MSMAVIPERRNVGAEGTLGDGKLFGERDA